MQKFSWCILIILQSLVACDADRSLNSPLKAIRFNNCKISLPSGLIATKYALLEGAAGDLGCPTTNIEDLSDGVGNYVEFEGGAIYLKARAKEAFSIKGKIFSTWLDSGGPYGILGFPTEDEEFTTMFRGLKQDFEKGFISWPWDSPDAVIHLRHPR